MARFTWLLGLCLLLAGQANGQLNRLSVQTPSVAFCGDTLHVGVYATFQNALLGVQFSLQWDTAQLNFAGYTAQDLSGGTPVISTLPADTGRLTYVWIDPGSGTLLDSTWLLDVVLVVKSSGVGSTISVVNFPTPTEATDVNFNTLTAPPDIVSLNGTVLLADPLGVCGAPFFSPAVVLLTESGLGVENARVDLNHSFSGGYASSEQAFSDAGGSAVFNNNLPYAADFTCTPFLDYDPTNGVTTYDIYLINRHILNLQPITSPYRQIAADVNHSNTITSTDILLLRRLILGLESGFPNNTSWRFVAESQTFSNAQNAFVDAPFAESAGRLQVASQPAPQRFVGIKTGDVNGSAIPNGLEHLDDRNLPVFQLVTEDRSLREGEVFEVEFRCNQPVLAFQGTLELQGIQVTDVDWRPDCFAVHEQGHEVSLAWEKSVENIDFQTIRLHCRAETAGWLSQLFSVGNRFTPTAATFEDGTSGDLRLLFAGSNKGTATTWQVFAPSPNPWSEQTTLTCWLPQPQELTFRVWDALGRLLLERPVHGEAGHNTVTLRREELSNSGGLLYCQWSGPSGTATYTTWLNK